MDQTLLEFIRYLRRKGVRISTSETMDAMRAAAMMPLESRDLALGVLGATLVKKPEDAERFAELLDIFFLPTAIPATADERSEDVFEGANADAIRALADALNLSGETRTLLAGNPVALRAWIEQLADEAGVNLMEIPLQINLMSYRMLQLMGWERMDAELAGALERLTGEGPMSAEAGILARRMQELRKTFPDRLRQWTRERWRQQKREDGSEFGGPKWLLDRKFSELTDADYRMLDAAIHRLAERIQGALAVRRKHVRRGKLNVRRTIRANLRNGGMPVNLVYDRRLRDKPKLVVICDISSSVAFASTFMLNLLYKLQSQFARVRSFLFIADLGEITDTLKRLPFKQAMDEAVRSGPYADNFRSDYGTAFRQFVDGFPGALTPRTTVLILGDGRTNQGDPQIGRFKWMSRQVERIVWLNPEPRSLWGSGDSAMLLYKPHCEMTSEVRTPAQLMAAIEKMARLALAI